MPEDWGKFHTLELLSGNRVNRPLFTTARAGDTIAGMTRTFISRDRAVKRLLRYAAPRNPECLPPFEAAERIASHNITAFCNVPEQSCSLRDGYAVRVSDIEKAGPMHPVRLTVTQTLRAESRHGTPVEPGEAARVLTGGMVPECGNAILAEEDVEMDNDAIIVRAPVRPGWFVRPTGGEIELGAVITRAGEIITPQAAAVMVRTRSASIHAYPVPRARVLALGSELSDPVCETANSSARFPADNLVLTGGLLQESGVNVVEAGVLPDNLDTLVETLSGDLPEVVVTTGGTGRSERDFARQGAERAGFTILFDGVDIRPGRNLFGAVRDNTLLFGLPGPPIAVFTCFHGLILPALRRLRGLPDQTEPTLARFEEGLSVRPGCEWLLPCSLHRKGAILVATPLTGKRVPPMLALGLAHGVAVIQGGDGVLPGGDVEIVTTRMD